MRITTYAGLAIDFAWQHGETTWVLGFSGTDYGGIGCERGGLGVALRKCERVLTAGCRKDTRGTQQYAERHRIGKQQT